VTVIATTPQVEVGSSKAPGKLENLLRIHHIRGSASTAYRTPFATMRTNHRSRTPAPAHLGFLLDELRSGGVTTYADLDATCRERGRTRVHGAAGGVEESAAE
jgi:hypothetical protein